MAKRKFKSSRILIFILAVIGILVLSSLAKRVQVLRSEASIPGNIGEVKASVQQAEGDLQKVSLSFHTGKNEENSEVVSYLSIRIEIPLEGGSVMLTDANGVELQEIMVVEEFGDSEGWDVPVNKIVTGDEMVVVDFALVNLTKDGFKSHELKHFADFYIKKGVVPVEVALNINKDYSFMYTKDRPVVNIWATPESLVIIR
jgi:hypothetical protein